MTDIAEKCAGGFFPGAWALILVVILIILGFTFMGFGVDGGGWW
ncbi:MAG: hypothetical protein AB1500_12090 [Bacillota bacterium]